jgi:hypothetical protein
VQNIPLSQTESEIENYFYSIIARVTKETYNKSPIMSVRKYEELRFVTLEFRKRADAEVCLTLNGTEYSSSCTHSMRIMRVKRFTDQWNDAIDKGRNPTIASKANYNMDYDED